MTERRTLVPSTRQIEMGDRASGWDRSGEGAVAEALTTAIDRPVSAWRRTLREADPRRIPGPSRPLIVFGLIALLSQWDDAALGTLLPEIRGELGLSTQTLAAISSLVSILALSVGIPFGHLADRVKRTTLLRISIIGSNLASVIQATAPGLSQLVTGRLVAGAGVGMQQPASFSFLADSFPSTSRTRVFGFTFVVAQIGAVLGPIVAGVMGQLFGWRIALGSLGILATGVGALTLLLREPVRGKLDRLEAGATEAEAEIEQQPLSLGESARAAWSVRTVRRIVIATPFLYLKGAASLGLLTLYFSEVFVLSPTQRGAIGASYAILGMIGLIAAAPLGDRLLANRPGAFLPLAAAGLVVQALALLLLGVTRNAPMAVLVAAPLSALDVVLAPAFFSLLSQVVPARVRGLGLQIITPAQLLGIIAFPLMAGLADRVGLQTGIALFALPTFVGALILAGGGPGTVRDRRTALAAGLAEESARRALAEGRDSVLVVRDLEAGYGSVPVLSGVDLDVDAGEVLVVLGPNGAGKTTLLRALAGVRQPTSGAVSILGRDASTAPAHVLARRGVALVPGGQAVIPGVTVLEHLEAAAALAHPDEQEAVDAAVEALLFEPSTLADRRGQNAGSLSGGEQQLLALACARLARPKLLLVDELSLGLAPRAVGEALAEARAAADDGAAVIVVEQSIDAAIAVADRVVVIEKGEITFSGSAAQAKANKTVLTAVALGGGRRTPPRSSPQRTEGLPALEVRGVGVRFGANQVLRDIHVDARPGELTGLIGPNGAGKTTLFDIISGFVTPDAGQVEMGGVDLVGVSPDGRARQGLGRSFQRARLFPGLTVLDSVLVALDRKAGPGASLAPLGLPTARRSEARLRRRAEGALELLDLDSWASVPVGDLPTGTRRLVSLACILAFEPSVLLLDEPTAGLSRTEAEEIPPLLRRTVRETGAALLVIEHDVPLLAAAADRLVAMVSGEIVAVGSPAEVVEHPAVISSYLGIDTDPTTPTRAGAGQED